MKAWDTVKGFHLLKKSHINLANILNRLWKHGENVFIISFCKKYYYIYLFVYETVNYHNLDTNYNISLT